MGSKGLFSTPFSVSLVFSPEPNKRKFHFPPIFLSLFSPQPNIPLQNIDWKVVFPLGIWNIWLHRNAVMFNDGRTRGSVRENTILQVMEFVFLGINEKHAASCNTIQVKWTKPPTNWYKENSDASSLGNLDLARGGGLIRDEMGKWIKGYARAIGSTTSVAAVLWAL